MSACKCGERDKPVSERAWVVWQRNCNQSAFNGYRRTYSDYSSVRCISCEAFWRTKANYVPQLKDSKMIHYE